MLLLTTNIKFPVLQLPWRPKLLSCSCSFFFTLTIKPRVFCALEWQLRGSWWCGSVHIILRAWRQWQGVQHNTRSLVRVRPACSGKTDMLFHPSWGQNCTFFTDRCFSLINHTQLWCYLPPHSISSLSFQWPACDCHLIASHHHTVIQTYNYTC